MIDSELIKELKSIKADLKYIKKHMVDIDFVLTVDEERMLREGIEEFERGDTVKLEDLKGD